MATTVAGPKGPRELYRIAKKQASWDPEQIPISEDRADWQRLTAGQQEQLLKICSLFYEGEVSVAETLAWWLVGMPDFDRKLFLVTQAFEEAKHAEFFEIYFAQVFGTVDTSKYVVGDYKRILVDGLRERAKEIGRAALAADGDEGRFRLEKALVVGTAHYMGILEGVLAVTGYDYFDEIAAARGILPRLLEGIRQIRADEGRHVTAGMDYLRGKCAEREEYAMAVREVFLQEATKIPAATDFVFQPNAFELNRDRMLAIAYQHFNQRMAEMGLA
ncbi:MAG TPA: ribonucleotide-diphosphate reductase subunit beta [Terriglobia bacterium]|jgi:ribonucleoside-diphosphate reductase beta chain|nr:ribonucleotide-diphosphate reductase subunit beta [Terriglobia bacterium]